MDSSRLYTIARIGADATGKTTLFQYDLLSCITAKYMTQASQQTTSECISLGITSSSDFTKEHLSRTTRFDSIIDQEAALAIQTSFYHDSQGNQDKIISMFLSLPAKGTSTWLPIYHLLKAQKPHNSQETFGYFKQNYHEAMDTYVYPFINNYPNPNATFVLQTDRSWICNLVYNTTKETLFNTDKLRALIDQSGYPPIDKVILHLSSPQTFEERFKARLAQNPDLPYPEAQGTRFLMEIQDRYFHLLPSLQNLGYVITYTMQLT